MVRQIVKTYTQEEKRKGISESAVVLAFPLTENEEPKTDSQAVHSFLPLRSYGFNFVIQADFLTSSSREDILSDLKWNITLRDAISTTFILAAENFKTRPAVQFNWFRFIPHHIGDTFFESVENTIHSELSRLPILRSVDGQHRSPSCFIIAKTFCDNEAKPLIPEDYLPGGLHYLTDPYDVDTDRTHFMRLGVRDMTESHFVQGLSNMGVWLHMQPIAWHEDVCCTLSHIFSNSRLIFDIRQLLIIPLSDGSWVPGSSAANIFFDSELTGVPQDIGLCILKKDIPQSYKSARYLLFRKFGVGHANAKRLADKILELHQSHWPPVSL